MTDQLTLLQETDWQTLIILDACRADYFADVLSETDVGARRAVPDSKSQADPGTGQGEPANAGRAAPGVPPGGNLRRAVPDVEDAGGAEHGAGRASQGKIRVTGMPPGGNLRSPAPCTKKWIHALLETGVLDGCLYVNANPVVTREVQRLGAGDRLALVDVWRHGWGRHTGLGIPSVHPRVVNVATLAAVGARRACGDGGPTGVGARRAVPGRLVVHFLQPHSPYIGEARLAMTRWGRDQDGLSRACRALNRPDKAVERGEITWDQVRRAYRANLRLAWEHVLDLLISPVGARRAVPFPAVITADHGEVLGEHSGRFGHECGWRYDELFEVPWLEVPADQGGRDDDRVMQARLKALGYA